MLGSVPGIVQQEVIRILSQNGSTPVKLLGFSFLAGGCINSGGRLSTSRGKFFVKWNEARLYPRMFETEARGLQLLRQYGTLHVPEVAGWFTQGSHQGIVLELIETNGQSKQYWQDLGRGLAALHQNTRDTFGLDHDNYIGSLPQVNAVETEWADFFIRRRLEPQLKMAVDHGRIDAETVRQFEASYQKLPQIFPPEKPALLHGDLWRGNVITDHAGAPCLIDPAIYYGHREAELAFTWLFGGFDDAFYAAYKDTYPVAPGFEQRMDLYNLYPLLVHVNLFGGDYASQVRSILRGIA